MRISTSQMQQYALNAMLDQQAKLSKTQLEVATGRRILSPADDPPAAVLALDLTQRSEALQQYQRNIDTASSSLEIEEGALMSIQNQLQRVRELAVQAENNALGAKGRLALSFEVQQLQQSVLAIANTQDASGQYIFSGFQSETAAYTDAGGGVFTYNGDHGQRLLEVAPGAQVAATDAGEQIFGTLPAAGGGVTDVFAVIYDFTTDLQSNVYNANTLTDLDSAMTRISSKLATIGARQNTLDALRDVNAGYEVDTLSDLSRVQDLDYAEAITRLNQQLAGLQAAQDSYSRIQSLSLFNFLR